MCVTWTVHYRCGCASPRRAPSGGCDGKCRGENIRYDESRDVQSDERCNEHAYVSPPTSSDTSVSDAAMGTPDKAAGGAEGKASAGS